MSLVHHHIYGFYLVNDWYCKLNEHLHICIALRLFGYIRAFIVIVIWGGMLSMF